MSCHANAHPRMDNETFIKTGGKLISIIYIRTCPTFPTIEIIEKQRTEREREREKSYDDKN